MKEGSGTDKTEGGVAGWQSDLTAWPISVLRAWRAKIGGRAEARRMTGDSAVPAVLPGALAALVDEWKRMELPGSSWSKESEAEAAAPLGESGSVSGSWVYNGALTDAERAAVHRIREETKRLNRNNVTRTEAYRAIYRRMPELHWALLAHLVSRNGGWNMTDLRGELLPRLLRPEQREAVFRLLERANALIFQDAYPQLLLYEEGRRCGRNLSRLLPVFGVSRFMRPVWDQYWRERHPPVLTTALIVNEQHYIEQRVVRNAYYKERVLDTLFFGLQSLLQLNLVIVPYRREEDVAHRQGYGGSDLRLIGRAVGNFADLQERIRVGRQLYAVLFGVSEIADGVRRFAAEVRHTGSRADYASHVFAPVRRGLPERSYRERMSGSRLRPGAEPLYSPALPDAWPDRAIEPAEPGDWFRSAAEASRFFAPEPLPGGFELTGDYWLSLGKLELAAVTASQLGAGADKP